MSERVQPPTRDKWGLDLPEYGPKSEDPTSKHEAKVQQLRMLGYFVLLSGASVVKFLDMIHKLPF